VAAEPVAVVGTPFPGEQLKRDRADVGRKLVGSVHTHCAWDELRDSHAPASPRNDCVRRAVQYVADEAALTR
jgi:hypothetical protein